MNKKQIDSLTIAEAREIAALFGVGHALQAPSLVSHPFQIGAKYFIRTVTHHYTGILEEVYAGELVLSSAAWIADSGRFHQAVTTGEFAEVEPYGADQSVIIGRSGILDAVIVPKIPTSPK